MKPQNRSSQGILFLCLGVFVFTIQDAIIKQISGTYPVTELVAIRSLVALPILDTSFFAELPRWTTIIGAMLIVTSGIAVLRNPRRLDDSATSQPVLAA
jgi:drug/metabolite transporter (DMT)-like permease